MAGIWGVTGWIGFTYYLVAHVVVSPKAGSPHTVQPISAAAFLQPVCTSAGLWSTVGQGWREDRALLPILVSLIPVLETPF